MKTIAKISAALIALTFVLSACSKYEDGPSFSLLTKKKRLQGEWVVESATYNDQDATAQFLAVAGSNYVLEIEKDGEYRTEGSDPDKGTWELGEDKDDIYFQSDDTNAEEVSYRILRLTNKEFWVRHTETNGDIWEIKYKAKD